MKKWKALGILQVVISLTVLFMSLINLSTPPAYDYFPGYIIQFLLGLMFGVMALDYFVKKQTLPAVFLAFVMIFSFCASAYIFF